jgi:hypothetical protein
MGKSNRSKAFHDVAWKNIKDAGFPDRSCGTRREAEMRKYNTVSVYGSASSQNWGAVLFHPESTKRHGEQQLPRQPHDQIW